MCKKLVYLSSFVLVLGLVGSASADLVAHWKFNNDATDSIGTADCTLLNGATYSTDSKEGSGSLSLDGVDDYAIPTASPVLYAPFSTETVAIWFKADTTTGTHVLYNEGGATNGLSIRINANTLQAAVRIGMNQSTASTGFASTEWTHVAVTFDNGSLKLYVNGAEQASATAGFGTVPSHGNASGIGARNGDDAFGNELTGDYFAGLIDDVQMYDNAFSAAEIADLVAGRPRAREPDPADGALLSDRRVNLGWTPGAYAVSHDVYFGDNLDDVVAGTGGTFQGNQTATRFRVGSPQFPYLVAGTTYYWRIDEVNDTHPESPWKGDVWSFMTPPKTAYDPYPADGTKFVHPNVELSWRAGFGVKLHHVYFGDNFANVNDADTSDTTGIYRSVQEATTYTPGPLELEKTYYWRVDEVEATRSVDTIHKGDVWSFTTTPEIAITDPNLLCWWTFDETEGTTAIDYSGHYHYGIVNGATWVANGQVGGALDFGADGDHVLDEDAENYLNGLDALTVSMWVKSNVTNTDKGFIVCEEPDGGGGVIHMRYDARGTGGGTNVLKMGVMSSGGIQVLESSSNLQTTEWQHVAMTWSTGQQLKFYVNGILDSPTANDAGAAGTLSRNVKLIIGKGVKDEAASAGWDGMIDDVRIYNIALSDAEIYALGVPSEASAPSPADGATDVTQTPTLRWTAGDRALQHDVYFGTDKEAVRNANMRSPEYKDTKELGSESYEPGKLEWNTTYYWRVDEYNTDATISEGRVWSFTVVVMTDPLAEALDTDLSFTTGGNADWFSQTTTSYYDGDAAQSGDISHSQDSWMQTTVSGTRTVKFYWKVSSENMFDFLEFYIDGSLQDQISGLVDWQQNTYTITTSGPHVLEWRYKKDASVDSDSDCGWVDKMEWVTN